MLGSVPGWLISGTRALVILAPRQASLAAPLGTDYYGPSEYETLLGRLQRLRGQAYLDDGAVEPSDLTSDGRHISPVDELSWHVLAIEAGGVVRGCARYLSHDPGVPFSRLTVKSSALAQDMDWGYRLRTAVEAETAQAQQRQLAFVEVGGWAIDKTCRFGSEALRIALGTYALSRKLGGCIGLTTATVRHRSAATLQKIGGSMLAHDGAPLPTYYDPQYKCEMAILRFQSYQAAPRFERWIDCLEIQLRTAPVIYHSVPRRVAIPQPRRYAAAAAASDRDRFAVMA
jgi:hypothetical protein